MSRVVICGSRDFTDWEMFKRCLEDTRKSITIGSIISGGCRGADTLAKRYAIEFGIAFKEYPADWRTYGKSAGAIRNQEMVDNCDCVIAFVAESSSSVGTKMTIRFAEKSGRCVFIHKV